MKLISQKSDPAWTCDKGRLVRCHYLTLVEAAGELNHDRFLPLLCALNRTEFGGIAPAKLLCYRWSATRNGDRWDISVTLRETATDYDIHLITTRSGERFKAVPQYAVAEFRDYLPRVERFPDTDENAVVVMSENWGEVAWEP